MPFLIFLFYLFFIFILYLFLEVFKKSLKFQIREPQLKVPSGGLVLKTYLGEERKNPRIQPDLFPRTFYNRLRQMNVYFIRCIEMCLKNFDCRWYCTKYVACLKMYIPSYKMKIQQLWSLAKCWIGTCASDTWRRE